MNKWEVRRRQEALATHQHSQSKEEAMKFSPWWCLESVVELRTGCMYISSSVNLRTAKW